MKNLFLLVLLSSFPLLISAQITFDKGYFIKNNGEKVECFISNEDWKNNPDKIEYRLSETNSEAKISINEIKAFEIYNVSKYIRYQGKVDISTDLTNSLTTDKEPILEEKTIFLKVLLEGNSTLYHFRSNKLTRFFYKIKDNNIEPLIYKRYLVQIDGNKQAADNAKFRRQLLVSMQCESMTMADVDKLGYNEGALVKYFLKYEECMGNEPTIYKKKGYKYNLGLTAGIASQEFDLKSPIFTDWNTTGTGFRFGIENEIVFPFNKNKWSLLIEPTYQYFRDSITVKNDFLTDDLYELDYQSIELQLGFRYYMFLNQNSKLFANILYVQDIDFNSALMITDINNQVFNFDINSRPNFAIGFGYKYKDLGKIEVRYYTPRNLNLVLLMDKLTYNNLVLRLTYDLI
ncbi:MAG: hypothetical protein AB8G11_13070 [Saprospiraceae bacterium]